MKILNNNIEIKLEEPCWNCSWSSSWRETSPPKVTTKDCDICNGKGVLLTENGRELLEFLKRHLDIKEK